MGRIKVRKDIELEKIEELGYTFNILEGAYVSKDGATIISMNRRPYEREVMQYKRNAESEHRENLEELKQIDALE